MNKETYEALGRIVDVVEHIYADNKPDGSVMKDAALLRGWMDEVAKEYVDE